MCEQEGRITEATIVDHVNRHNGDAAKFFGGPFQSLCKQHHDAAKQSYEVTGKQRGCDINGRPLRMT